MVYRFAWLELPRTSPSDEKLPSCSPGEQLGIARAGTAGPRRPTVCGSGCFGVDTLRRPLLLVLFGLGTNVGVKRVVVTGKHGESEATLRRVRHLFGCSSPPWSTSTRC